MASQITLFGRLFVSGLIEAKTGLHIGSSGGAFAIGSVDKPVIVNPITGQPYIPGSSLRGKMRSLTEKYLGLPLRSEGRAVSIHEPTNESDYQQSPVAQLYGIAATDFSLPTRLVVRDVPLLPESVERLRRAKTELPYTEVKTEVSIDRITSQANPRQLERVPAGAVFGPMELIFSLYRPEDSALLNTLLDGLILLEDDYLGGQGSRGSGKVEFRNISLTLKAASSYRSSIPWETFTSLTDLTSQVESIQQYIDQQLFGS
jgi:CRISPR-associated protein Csm3